MSRAVLWPGLLVLAGLAATALAGGPGLYTDVLLLLTVTSAACALIGVWLVLRRRAMMSDAIAHAILFGIVMMYFVVQDTSSPLFILGAAGAGLLTVFLVETLLRTGLVREDAAIGLVFPFLFALALLIIALSFRDVHLDEHVVLAGGVEITVLDQVLVQDATLPGALAGSVGGLLQAVAPPGAVRVYPGGAMLIDQWALGPRGLWTMALILLLDLLFVALLWKELKLTTFDAGLAAALGLAPAALGYGLMALASVTAVGAFQAVGSILVIALFIAPPATAYLLTENLGEMTGLSIVFALAAVLGGFHLGRALDANFGGSVATVSGALFLVVLLAAPEQGLVSQALRRRRQRLVFAQDMLLVHLDTHAGTAAAAEETAVAALPRHLRWDPAFAATIVERALAAELVARDNGHLVLTAAGAERAGMVVAAGG